MGRFAGKFDNDPKFGAREKLAEIYTDVSGNVSIPIDRGYWTLANDQTLRSAEIRQFIESGLLLEEQFHGVDTSASLIAANLEMYRKAHWYCGWWRNILLLHEAEFNPDFVYLDVTECPSLGLANMFALTVGASPRGAVIALNTMINNPNNGQKYDEGLMPELINRRMKENMPKGVGVYKYSGTGRTVMVTYVYQKK